MTARRRLACYGLTLGLLATIAHAQDMRVVYRDAYRIWKTTDSNLERDAAAGGPDFAGRADKVAVEAAKFTAARQAFLEAWSARMTGNSATLEAATGAAETESTIALAKTFQNLVTAQSESLARSIETFKSDPDPGIQKVRQAMEREQAALATLNEAIAQRQKPVTDGAAAATMLSQTRAKMQDQYQAVGTALMQVAGETGKQAVALASYYKKLSEVASAPAKPAAPASGEARTSSGITPLPLARYVGEWIFQASGPYLGPQPETFELVVHEENGKCSGTLSARFKLPAGAAGDPLLRFDFSGDFQNERNQSFPFVTSDGANGIIELIPGSAFNLLEVTFHTDPKPGKVRQANVVLVKK